MGLGASAAAGGRCCLRASGVRAGIGGLGRRPAFRDWNWNWRRRVCGRRKRRLVPAGATRSLCPVLSREPELRKQRERIEHYSEYDGGEQLLQHNCLKQQCECDEREVYESK